MEYRRIKYSRWKNVKSIMKNTIYNYYQKHKNDFKKGELPKIDTETNPEEVPFLTYDTIFYPDGLDEQYGHSVQCLRANMNILIRDLTDAMRDPKSQRFFKEETRDEFYSKIKAGEDPYLVDLFFVAKLYGDIQDKSEEERMKEMTIMEIPWKDGTIPVLMGSIYDHPDRVLCMTLEYYFHNLQDPFYPKDDIRWLVSQLLCIPVPKTSIPYEIGLSRNPVCRHLEDWILSAINKHHVTFRTSNLTGDLSDYYYNLRVFFDTLSDASINVSFLYVRDKYNKIFTDATKGDPYDLLDLEELSYMSRTIRNIPRDLCNIINYVVYMASKDENTWNHSDRVRYSLLVLEKFGIPLDRKTYMNEGTFITTNSFTLDATNLHSSDIPTVKEEIGKTLDVVKRVETFDRFLITLMGIEAGCTARSIERLTTPAFLLLMKTYFRLNDYVYNFKCEDIGRIVYPYHMTDRRCATLPIIYTAFMMRYKGSTDPFRYLPYIAPSYSLASMLHDSYTSWKVSDGEGQNTYREVFSLMNTGYINTTDARAHYTYEVMKHEETILQFLYHACNSYQCNLIANIDGKYEYRFSCNDWNADNERLVEICDGYIKNDIADNTAFVSSTYMNDDACDVIKKDFIEYVNDNSAFESKCYNITSYIPNGCTLMKNVISGLSTQLSASGNANAALFILRMLRK